MILKMTRTILNSMKKMIPKMMTKKRMKMIATTKKI